MDLRPSGQSISRVLHHIQLDTPYGSSQGQGVNVLAQEMLTF